MQHQPRPSGIATTIPTARNSLLPNAAASKLRPSQLAAPRAALPVKAIIPAAKAVDELNATVVMDKPSVVQAPPVQSGIPRPSLSRIPMPRTMK